MDSLLVIQNCESALWLSVSTVSADGLALPGARTSAGTVMTSIRSHIYTGPALEGLKKCSAQINSLTPGRSWHDFKNVNCNLAFLIGIFKSSYDNILRWMPQGRTGDKSTLVPVMAWCRQATSHYLNQCWPRSPMPYGVTRPQWVKCRGY